MPKLPFIENFSWSWNVDFQFYKELCFRDRNKKTVTNVGLFQDLKIPPEISKFCQTHTHTLCMCVYYTHTCIEAKLSGSRRFQEAQKFSKLSFFSIHFFICSYLLFHLIQHVSDPRFQKYRFWPWQLFSFWFESPPGYSYKNPALLYKLKPTCVWIFQMELRISFFYIQLCSGGENGSLKKFLHWSGNGRLDIDCGSAFLRQGQSHNKLNGYICSISIHCEMS